MVRMGGKQQQSAGVHPPAGQQGSVLADLAAQRQPACVPAAPAAPPTTCPQPFPTHTHKQTHPTTMCRGVLVRASVAEAREAAYRSAGRDCYLFNLDDVHVLDATLAGAITRFTVRADGGGG